MSAVQESSPANDQLEPLECPSGVSEPVSSQPSGSLPLHHSRTAPRRWRSYAWASLASLGVAAAYLLTTPPVYRPECLVYVALLLCAAILALGCAAIVRHSDSLVHTARDVERILGIAPLAQLPDFDEISPEEGDRCLMQLANALSENHSPRRLKSSIVTGVTPRVGTTTIASGLIRVLAEMGGPAILLHASGEPPPAREPLTQQIVECMDAGTIVLADTAPVLASAETEYLGRFVDSAIVVIQSGLTTRAQLQAVAQMFERLEISAVVFILNRVSRDTANRYFHLSVRGCGEPVVVESPPTAAAPGECGNAQEPFLASEYESVKQPEDKSAPSPQQGNGEENGAVQETPGAVRQGAERETPAPPRVTRGRGEPARLAAGAKASRPVPSPRSSPAPVPPGSSPAAPALAPPQSPLSGEPPSPKAAIKPAQQTPQPRSTPLARTEPLPDDLAREEDEAGYGAPSRLSSLRNLLVTLGRRSLNQEQESPCASDADLEPRFEKATVRPASSDTPESVSSGNGTPARLTAQPEFLRPKQAVEPEQEEREVTVRPTPPRRDKPDPEEIQTLPSWRGQYRKKRYPPL